MPKSIKDSFDWIVGTSTGGILALALAKGFSVLESQKIYLRMKAKVFNAAAMPYDVNQMSKLLRAEFGDTTMADLPRHPKLVRAYISQPVCPLCKIWAQ